MRERSGPARRVHLIFTLVVACIVATTPSDARAERPLSLFLLPPLVDELVEMVVPLQVNSDLGPNQSVQFWIVESRYCGASATHMGKFVAVAVPDLSSESKALRTLGAEDCRRSLGEVAQSSAAAHRAQAWVAAVSLRAVWQPSRLQLNLMAAQTTRARDGAAPTLPIPVGGLTIAEVRTSDVRVEVADQLDLTLQLAAAFFDDSARVSVSRTPLQSPPRAGPPARSAAPSATRAIAQLPHEALNSILERDLIEQELVFDHSVSGEQRFTIQKASVASPDPETYAVSGQSIHVGTDESFTINVLFRGDDLRVDSMALEQQLDDCGTAPPVSELEAWTSHTKCAAEFALRRGAAEVGSALLTKAYRGRTLRPTGSPTPLQVWLDGHHFSVAVSVLKASVQGDALTLYLQPTLSRDTAQ